jgi:hypothetical protein
VSYCLIYLIVPAATAAVPSSSNPVNQVVAAYRTHQTFQKGYQFQPTFSEYKGLIGKNPIT